MKTTNPNLQIAETDTLEADKIHFAVLAIEAAARKMGISPAEMRSRLKKQQLIEKRLIKHYGLLHTQSISWIADDLTETLQNWEAYDAENTTTHYRGIKQKGGRV